MSDDCWDVIVVGAGAAGLLAAERSAASGKRTLLLEKNRKPGVKILISGGTRCNVTHDTDARGIVAAFGRQGRFLHSALAHLSPREVVVLLRDEGVPTKVEKYGKVFPVSDTAVDVQQALLRRLDRSGAKLLLAQAVRSLRIQEGLFELKTESNQLRSRSVIVTSGGQSYPGCGTTGDGYAWAREFGHSIVPTVPSLAPLTTSSAWIHALQGLTLEDVSLTLAVSPVKSNLESPSAEPPTSRRNKLEPSPAFRGPIVLTHFGISGPAAMNISRFVEYAAAGSQVDLICDFLPSETEEQLFQRLRGDCLRNGKRQLTSILGAIVFQRLAEALLETAQLVGQRHAGETSNHDLRRLCEALKRQRIPLTGTMGYPKAEVTAGGVALNEVDSSTMQSKRCPGLFFAGEILDLDGPIGGYNFQAAFSTGWLAGMNAGKQR